MLKCNWTQANELQHEVVCPTNNSLDRAFRRIILMVNARSAETIRLNFCVTIILENLMSKYTIVTAQI